MYPNYLWSFLPVYLCLHERLLFLVGLCHERQPFFPIVDKLIWCDETHCSPRMWNMPKPKAVDHFRQVWQQSDFPEWLHTGSSLLEDPLYFPSMFSPTAALRQRQHRDQGFEKVLTYSYVHSSKALNQDQDPVFPTGLVKSLHCTFLPSHLPFLPLIFFLIKYLNKEIQV